MARNTPPVQKPQASPEAALLRINKALADAGVCSRRAADELVAAGAVTVNGQPVTSPGLRIDPATDVVELRGQRVAVPVPGARAHTLVMLNKPTGVVTTASDPQGRTTVLDLVGDAFGPARLYPVGRLDYFSQGLLLLTDHGELANRLTHPRWHLPKVYEVLVRGTVPPATLALFSRGMTLADGQALAPAPTRVLGVASRATSLEMTLTQGVNRQIRRMCEQAGLTILRLTRVALGPLRLGELPEGQARALTPGEAVALLHAVGLGPAPEQAPPAGAPGAGKPRPPAPAKAPARTTKGQPGGAARGPRRRG
ncbi:pseudouridine synthase [Desulfocurvus vexinensis]|uniref:pseudouridine synthase n=1 Tax=Desulfocurvus vexinensis TaxID=399548 RepID=UPI0004B5E0E9|nr:pseudouridine synthase [Desulfocurvus vexinensis]